MEALSLTPPPLLFLKTHSFLFPSPTQLGVAPFSILAATLWGGVDHPARFTSRRGSESDLLSLLHCSSSETDLQRHLFSLLSNGKHSPSSTGWMKLWGCLALACGSRDAVYLLACNSAFRSASSSERYLACKRQSVPRVDT